MFLFSINLVMEISYWGIFSMFVCRGSWAGLRHSGTQHGKPFKRGQHKRSVPERTDYYYISCQSENEPQRTHLVLSPQHHCLCILMANKFKMLQLPQIELDDIYANITLISVHQSVTVQYITAGCLPCQTYYSYRLSVLQTLTITLWAVVKVWEVEHKWETMSVCNLLATKAKLTATIHPLHWEYTFFPQHPVVANQSVGSATRLMLQQLMLTDIFGGRLHHTDCVMCNTGVGAEATVHNDRCRTFKENYHISGGKGGKVETRNKTHPESCIFSRCCSICIIMWESLGSCTDVSLKRWENWQNHTSASSTWPSQPQHLVTKAVRWTTSWTVPVDGRSLLACTAISRATTAGVVGSLAPFRPHSYLLIIYLN